MIHTHDVHTCQLRPDLREDSDVGTVDHTGFEEIQVSDILVAAFKFTHGFDVLQFEGHKWAVWIAFAVDEGQHAMAILPTVLAS